MGSISCEVISVKCRKMMWLDVKYKYQAYHERVISITQQRQNVRASNAKREMPSKVWREQAVNKHLMACSGTRGREHASITLNEMPSILCLYIIT
jgi:hypothetical protein